MNFSFFYIIKYTGDRQTFCQTYQQIHAISGLRDMCRHGSDLSDLHYCPLVYLRVEQIGKLHNNLLFNVEMLDAQICLALLKCSREQTLSALSHAIS